MTIADDFAQNSLLVNSTQYNTNTCQSFYAFHIYSKQYYDVTVVTWVTLYDIHKYLIIT